MTIPALESAAGPDADGKPGTAPRPRRMVQPAFLAAGLGLVGLAAGMAAAVRGSDAADPLLTYAVVGWRAAAWPRSRR